MTLVALIDEFLPCLPYFHIPNGEKRDESVAVKLKRMGVRPGPWDLCFPTLFYFIEMKVPGASLTDEQVAFRDTLSLAGYEFGVYTDPREALAELERRVRGSGHNPYGFPSKLSRAVTG